MVPETGARLTCTSKIERKMLTRCPAKPSSHELAPKYHAVEARATAATNGPAANLYPSATIPGRPCRARPHLECIVPEDGGWRLEVCEKGKCGRDDRWPVVSAPFVRPTSNL